MPVNGLRPLTSSDLRPKGIPAAEKAEAPSPEAPEILRPAGSLGDGSPVLPAEEEQPGAPLPETERPEALPETPEEEAPAEQTESLPDETDLPGAPDEVPADIPADPFFAPEQEAELPPEPTEPDPDADWEETGEDAVPDSLIPEPHTLAPEVPTVGEKRKVLWLILPGVLLLLLLILVLWHLRVLPEGVTAFLNGIVPPEAEEVLQKWLPILS